MRQGAGDLDEPHPALHQAAGAQTLERIEALEVVGAIEAVEAASGGRFGGDVGDLGNGGLHAEGRLVVLNGGLNRLAVGRTGREAVVLLGQEVELPALYSRWVAGDDVINGDAARPQGRRGVRGGQVGAGEVLEAAVGNPVIVQ